MSANLTLAVAAGLLVACGVSAKVGSCGAAATSSPNAPGGILRFNVVSAASAFFSNEISVCATM